MTKVIKVNKISLVSLNALIKHGFMIILTQITKPPRREVISTPKFIYDNPKKIMREFKVATQNVCKIKHVLEK